MANLDEYGGRAPGLGVLVVTTNDLPGYRADKVIGEVLGLTARSRNVGSRIGAGLKPLAGGELRGLANAVLMVRFDVSEGAGAATEVRAYGCAAAISPLS